MTRTPEPMIWPFPMPASPTLIRAYDNLYLAANGTDAQKRALGNPAQLPRPWDPGSITNPQLRYETWQWLEDVVTWFNHELVWNLGAGYIPACWPRHSHLVHEIAVLADQRRQASTHLTSDKLEEWHRYTVPNFLERLRQRVHDACEPDHTDWPGRTKHHRHGSNAATRRVAFLADCDHTDQHQPGDCLVDDPDDPSSEPAATEDPPSQSPASHRPRLHLVDPSTGEILR